MSRSSAPAQMKPAVMKSAVFLDRDGVLNRAIVRGGKPFPPASPLEMEILPGVIDACRRLKAAGRLLFCVTNQPDVARGAADQALIEEMNHWLGDAIGLDDVAVCWHDDADHCDCRKPLPGLLQRLATQYGVDLAASVMVGDRWRDVEAGQRALCGTVFIDNQYDEKRPEAADAVFVSLADAVDWIIDFPKRS